MPQGTITEPLTIIAGGERLITTETVEQMQAYVGVVDSRTVATIDGNARWYNLAVVVDDEDKPLGQWSLDVGAAGEVVASFMRNGEDTSTALLTVNASEWRSMSAYPLEG